MRLVVVGLVSGLKFCAYAAIGYAIFNVVTGNTPMPFGEAIRFAGAIFAVGFVIGAVRGVAGSQP